MVTAPQERDHVRGHPRARGRGRVPVSGVEQAGQARVLVVVGGGAGDESTVGVLAGLPGEPQQRARSRAPRRRRRQAGPGRTALRGCQGVRPRPARRTRRPGSRRTGRVAARSAAADRRGPARTARPLPRRARWPGSAGCGPVPGGTEPASRSAVCASRRPASRRSAASRPSPASPPSSQSSAAITANSGGPAGSMNRARSAMCSMTVLDGAAPAGAATSRISARSWPRGQAAQLAWQGVGACVDQVRVLGPAQPPERVPPRAARCAFQYQDADRGAADAPGQPHDRLPTARRRAAPRSRPPRASAPAPAGHPAAPGPARGGTPHPTPRRPRACTAPRPGGSCPLPPGRSTATRRTAGPSQGSIQFSEFLDRARPGQAACWRTTGARRVTQPTGSPARVRLATRPGPGCEHRRGLSFGLCLPLPQHVGGVAGHVTVNQLGARLAQPDPVQCGTALGRVGSGVIARAARAGGGDVGGHADVDCAGQDRARVPR